MLVGIGSKDFSGRRLLSHVGTWGTVPQLGLGRGSSPCPVSPVPAGLFEEADKDGPTALSLGNPQGSDPAFISARSAVVGASGKKTKERCHCGQGLGFLTGRTHSL